MPRWHFYAQDDDRAWGHNNHTYSLGHLVTGAGRTLAAAIEEARRKAEDRYGDPELIDDAVAIPEDHHFRVADHGTCKHCGGHHARSPEDLCPPARDEYDRLDALVGQLLGPDIAEAA